MYILIYVDTCWSKTASFETTQVHSERHHDITSVFAFESGIQLADSSGIIDEVALEPISTTPRGCLVRFSSGYQLRELMKSTDNPGSIPRV